jgi:hypothetical protein
MEIFWKILLCSNFLKYAEDQPCKEQRAEYIVEEYFDTFVQSVYFIPKLNPVGPET